MRPRQSRLDHAARLNDRAHVQVAVADTGIEQSALDEDEQGLLKGRACAWDLTQAEARVRLC